MRFDEHQTIQTVFPPIEPYGPAAQVEPDQGSWMVVAHQERASPTAPAPDLEDVLPGEGNASGELLIQLNLQAVRPVLRKEVEGHVVPDVAVVEKEDLTLAIEPADEVVEQPRQPPLEGGGPLGSRLILPRRLAT